MFKILVADDEKFIRKGIIAILQRDLEEEVECLEAKNGSEALDIATSEHPNLIITDISMPGCNGLDFIRALNETNRTSTVIILSGYENFEYARNAIKLGVKEYILKPIKKQEFLALIKRYVTDIKKVETRTKDEIIRNVEKNIIINQLRHDFLVGLLNCATIAEASDYLDKLKSLGITFQSMLFVCAVVQYKTNKENGDYIDFAVKNILDEYLNMEDSDHVATVKYEPGKVVVIFEGEELKLLQNSKRKLLRKAGNLIREYCKTDVFIGLGGIAYDSMHLYKSLKHGLAAVDFKIYESGDTVEVYGEIPKGPEYKPIDIGRLMKPINQANAVMVTNAFEFLNREAKSKNALNTVKNAYGEFVKIIYNQIGHYEYLGKQPVKKLKEFSAFWNIRELKKEIRDCMEQLQEMMGKGENDISNKKLMAEILRYIQDNITKEVDLSTVAEQFSRTPGYISTLFKKGTNDGFNSYITNERIKIAKKLLEESTVPIQQVGELCGYPNSKYFSVVFKKVVGESPKSYREKIIKA